MIKAKILLSLSVLFLITYSCKKEYVPVVTTTDITTITSSGAISGGTIIDAGGSEVIEQGICWGVTNNPTTSVNKKAVSLDDDSFLSDIKNLEANTTYYVRAYAVNSIGIGYGDELSFTTTDPTSPEISTKAFILPFFDGAYYALTSGGDIYTDGGMPILSRGICWSKSNQVPTLLDSKTVDGSGKGSYLSRITGVQRGTTYFARAYAINSIDTVYGNTVSYTSPCHMGFLNYYSLSLTSPLNESVGKPLDTKLIWSCHSEGTVVFDIYLDTVPDPIRKFATNISANSIILSALDSATTYYWKVYAWNPLLSCETYTTGIQSFSTVGRPVVLPTQVTEYTLTSAIVGCNVTSDGGKIVTENGVYWSISPNPSITGSKFPIGSGVGEFSGTLSGLSPNTKYYVQGYAINYYGIAFSNFGVSFTTDQNTFLPSIISSPVIIYNSTSATVGGFIASEGSFPVTERGIFWSTSQNPESTGAKLQIGNRGGSFTSGLSGLNPNTTYYLKAFAINQAGTVYGSQISFNTGQSTSPPSVTDVDGNIYNIVKIGNQTWMAENLKTTKYANGTAIPLVNTVSAWNSILETSKAYSWYNDDISYKDTYGALYSWAAAMNGTVGSNNKPSGVQGVCPTGWHLPSEAEWLELEKFLGGSEVAGGKMKETGTVNWIEPNAGATNQSGFTGKPGGYRIYYGFTEFIGTFGLWWSSTESVFEFQYNTAKAFSIDHYGTELENENEYRPSGISVRCVLNY